MDGKRKMKLHRWLVVLTLLLAACQAAPRATDPTIDTIEALDGKEDSSGELKLHADGLTLFQEGDQVSERSVGAEQFGRFLSTIFDEWIRHDVGRVYVQTIEAALRNWLGLEASGMCVFNQTCGTGLAIEHNGDVYACDHFVEPNFLLGNIHDEHMIELVAKPQQIKFAQNKFDDLPRY